MRLEAVPRALDVPAGSVPTNLAARRNDGALVRLGQRLKGATVHCFPSMVDRAALRRVDYSWSERVQVERELWNVFDTEPLEDGVNHPAEQIIEGFVRSAKDAEEWLAELALDETSPAFAAAVLRCLSRVAGVGSASWREKVVRGALASSDVQMRDAALQAAEEWGEPAMCAILQAHVSSEPVAWLRAAAEDVIEDLA